MQCYVFSCIAYAIEKSEKETVTCNSKSEARNADGAVHLHHNYHTPR